MNNNEIIEKLLENSELRDKYEKQLSDLKREEPLVRLKSTTNQNSSITTTTISVNNPINSNNQSIILKTLNTGMQSNQTQIKTTEALRSLISAANTNNTNTTNMNLKQVILTNKNTTPKVILVPNNNVKNTQVEDLTNYPSSTTQPQQQQTTPSIFQLSSNSRILMPKITTISTNHSPSIQKLVFLKSSSTSMIDTRSLKIITPPIVKNYENTTKQQHQFITTQASKPNIVLNSKVHEQQANEVIFMNYLV